MSIAQSTPIERVDCAIDRWVLSGVRQRESLWLDVVWTLVAARHRPGYAPAG